MMTHWQLRNWPGRAAALLALLALALRLSAAMAMPVPTVATLDVLLGVPICHAGGETPDGQPAAPAHDCTLCPACFIPLPGFAAAPAFTPAPPPVAMARFVLPAAGAGPPAHPFATPQPRAPPHPA